MNVEASHGFMIGLNAVIIAVTDDSPRVLTVQGAGTGSGNDEGLCALPLGPLDAESDRTLERVVRGWVYEQAGLELGYVEQLYTFGDRNRDPLERRGGPRVISVAYLALVREGQAGEKSRAKWMDYYGFLPWEDWREGRPKVIDDKILPYLEEWASEGGYRALKEVRKERLAICFGVHGAEWDGEKVLERYELLYEAGLVGESTLDRKGQGPFPNERASVPAVGHRMALDHRRMLATALGRLRGKIKYRPVVFELLPPSFTLLQLQRVVEALAGIRLHKQNFRRLVDKGGLVEGTGQLDQHTGGRPAEVFRFRRDVLRERRAPGVGLPGG